MKRTYDFYGPDGQRAVIYSAAARHGQRVEMGLQVWNTRTAHWDKFLCTQLLPTDVVGICFELQRLCDKAQASGFKLVDTRKEVVSL